MNIDEIAKLKKKFYMGEESPEDVMRVFFLLESSAKEINKISNIDNMVYSFGFKHNYKTFINKWKHNKSLNLNFMLSDLFEEIDHDLFKKEHIDANIWF